MSQPFIVILLSLLLTACGGSSDDDNRLGRIDIIPGVAEIGIGETLQLEILGVLNDGQTADISPTAVDWLSNDVSIATVSDSGLLTATGEGVATITATTSGITGFMTATVTPGLRLQILPPLVIDPIGTQRQLRALGFQSDFETIDLTDEVTWASADDAIATVDASGLLTIVSNGEVRVSATLRTRSDDIQVIGNDTELDSIEITPAIKIVPINVEVNFSASGVFNDGSVVDLTEQVTWTSSDIGVAPVDEDGTAIGLAVGSTQITAEFFGFRDVAPLLVTGSDILAVSVLPNSTALPVGVSEQFQMLAFYVDGVTENVTNEATWSTSNESAATVTSSGLVSAQAPGVAAIRGSFSGVSATGDVTVSSAVLSTLRIAPVNKSTPVGVDIQYEATGVYSDGSTDDLTDLVDWQTGNTDIAVIDIDGLARTVSAGGTSVTASYSSPIVESPTLVATTNLSVTSATLVSIQHVPAFISGPAGTSEQLLVRAIYSDDSTVDVTRESTFVSANGDIAAVQSFGAEAGLVSLLLPGTTTITTSFGGVEDTVDVTVTSAELVSVQLSPVAQQLPVGLFVQYTAFGLFTDGTSEDISDEIFWQSGDPTIIAIDENGLALGLSIGNAIVSGAYQGDAKTAILNGTLSTLIAPLPTGLRLAQNDVKALDSKVGFSAVRITEAEVTSVQITPANVNGPAGISTQLTLTAVYTDGTTLDATKNAIWITTDPTIAAVGVNGETAGLLELLRAGETTAAATFAGKIDSTQVLVSEAELVSVGVFPGTKSLPKGIQQQFQAIGIYSDGNSAFLTNVVSWQTSDSVVASVTATGLLTANSPGDVSVIANIDGFTASSDVIVTEAELTRLQIVPLAVAGPVGKREQLTLIAYYSDGTTSDATVEATWFSDSPSIALVDNNLGREGRLYLLAEGNATVSASWDGQEVSRTQVNSNSIDVTVTAAVLAEIILSPRDESIPLGIEVSYVATGIYSDLSNQDITAEVSWVSSKPSVATITADGKATAISEGGALISATLSEVVSVTPITVTPASVVSVAIEPPVLEGPSGRLARLTATALLSDNSTEDVTQLATWQSIDTNVAAVVSTGLAGGLTELRVPGETQISVNFQSASDVITVQVSSAVLEQINIQPVNASVAAGLSVQYEASGLYSDGQTLDLSDEVSWQSSDLNVAVIGQDGEASTGDAGTSTISAALSGITSAVSLIVTDAVLTDLQLTPASIAGPSGTQSQLMLTGYYSDGSSKDLTSAATFISSDTNIAAIQSGTSEAGRVSLNSVGTVTATASFGGLQETSSITVTQAVLESIEVTPSNQSRPVGINVQYKAFGIYSDGGSKDITNQVSWSSSNTAVVSISQSGLAVGVSNGSAVITANDDVTSTTGTTNLVVTDAILTDLVIDPRFLSEPVGTSSQLTARAYFSDGQDADATIDASWSSSDGAIVDVVGTGDSAGLVTMVSAGSAEVSASWNGIRAVLGTQSNVSDTVPITVTTAELVSIELTPVNATLPAGINQQYTASGLYTDGTRRDVTNEVTWQTADQGVAVILSSGLLASVAQGATSVTATLGAISESTTLTVSAALVTSVLVTPGLVDEPAGSSTTFTLTAFYSDNSRQNVSADATWTSSNTASVVVVTSGENGGQASLEAAGTATVTAAYSGLSSTASVTVSPAVVISIQLNPATATIAKGLSLRYEVVATYSDGRSGVVTENISWRSSDTNVAAVSSEGLALGLGQGAATISAQLGGVSDDATITVTEPILADLQIEPASIAAPAGSSTQLIATAFYTDFSSQDVTREGVWSSDDEAVARVGVTGDVGGQLDFVAVGSTQVNMSFGGQQASSSVVTADAVLTSIVVTPPIERVPAGMQVEYMAQGIYSNNTSSDITDDVIWQTSDNTIATIDQQGIAQGISVGVTAVSATLGDIEKRVALSVTNAVVTAIQVTPANFSAPAGTSKQYTAEAFFSDGTSSNATSEAAWLSEDESVAVVIAGGQSAGLVELLAQGSTQISATLSGFTDTVDVTATAAVLETISVSPANEAIPLGIEIQYQANGTYSDGSSSDLTSVVDWSSTAPQIITISDVGLASAVGVGTVDVRASFDGVVGSTAATVTAAILSSLEITPAFLVEPKGSSIQLNARAIYTDGTVHDATQEATWSSSDPAIVVVGATGVNGGLASMVETGAATISASWNGTLSAANDQSDTIAVVVTSAVLDSIAISPVDQSLPAGVEEQYTATGLYSDGTTTDITDSVSWQSGSTSIATIDGDGLLSGVSVGQTTVTAMLDAISQVTNVTVTQALLTDLQITPAGLSEPAGTSARLTLTAFYSDNTNKDVTTQASWVSSNSAVATVVTAGTDAGLVNFQSVGSTDITANFEGLNDVTPVDVTDAELVSIQLSPFATSLPIGIEQAYTATGIFTDGSSSIINEDVSWTISDSDVASITNAGIVKALAQGSVVVTATSASVVGQTDLTVTEAELSLLQIVPLTVTGPIGKRQQLTLIAYYSDGSTTDATQVGTWTSTSPNIAFVDNSEGREGQLYLLSQGAASVSAAWDGQDSARVQIESNSIDVIVTAAVLIEIVVSPQNESIPLGVEVDYTATGIYSDLSNQDITDDVSWLSSESSVATITTDGKATAIGEGVSVISAALADKISTTNLTVTPASVVSVSIDPPFLNGPSGNLSSLVATALLSDNSTEDVTQLATWQSLDTDVVGVVTTGENAGVVEFRIPGATQITVSFKGVSDSIPVLVSSAVLEEINVQPVNATVAAGLSVQYEATGLYSDGQNIDISHEVFWQSNNVQVAAIGPDGEAFAGEAGTAMISAALSGITSSVPLVVTNAVLTELQLTPVSITAPSGTQAQLNLTGYYSDNTSRDLTSEATFSSSNTNVAVIQTGTSDAGSVNLVSVGSAIATASFGGLQKTSSITVTAAVLESINVTPFNQTKPVGISIQYQAVGLYSDNTSKDISNQVSWSSSDAAIASISTTGKALGLVTGSVVVTANDDASSILGATNLAITDAVLTQLTITPSSLSGPIGTSTQLTAQAIFSDGQEEDATTQASWISDDVLVVDVVGTGDGAGLVTLIGTGSANVSASWNGIRTIVTLASDITDTIPVTVTDAELVSIELTPLDTSLPVGVDQQYAATGFYTDTSSRDISNEVTWQTSDQNVAVILNSGLLTSVGQGAVTVTATSGQISQVTSLTVTPAVVTSVVVVPDIAEEPAGSIVTFVLMAFYSDSTNQDVSADATWTSSNTSTVLVSSGDDGGLALLVAQGSASVTAVYNEFSSSASVTVTPAVITSIQVNPGAATTAKGLSVQYEVMAIFSDGTHTPVTENIVWTSSDTGVSTVSSEGLALGFGEGEATISAEFEGFSDDAAITVTAPILVDLEIAPSSIIEPAGSMAQLVATAIYSDASTQIVTSEGVWTSDDDTVASVGATGVVGGLLDFVAIGSTLVNVTFGDQQASATVMTSAAELTTIVVTPPIASVPAGLQVEYMAQGIYSDSTSGDITGDVIWQTSNDAIATIEATGVAEGVGAGIAVISATLGSIETRVPLIVTAAVVTSIQVTPPNFSAPAGTSKQYSAEAFFSDGTSSNATSEAIWTSGNNLIATVTATGPTAGLVALLAQGPTTISASLSGLTDTVVVTATAAVLQTISVSPVNEEIPLGIEIQYQANGTYSDGTTNDLTDIAQWSSNAPATLTITDTGLALGVGVGSAEVSASFEGTVGQTNATVSSAILSSLEITPAFLIEPKGSIIQLNAQANFSDGTVQDVTQVATWSSSDADVVVVGVTGENGGVATMIEAGAASISVAWDGVTNVANLQSDTIAVIVTNAVLDRIEISPVDKALPAGVEEQYTATGVYSDGTKTDITDSVSWQSGSTSIATIDGDGLLSAVLVGQTTVTAMLDGVSEVTNVTVTAALLTALQITPANLSDPAGTSARLTLLAFYSDNTNKDVTTLASWVSNAPNIASVETSGTDAGLVQLLTVGTTDITATFDGQNDVAPVVVTDAELVSIEVSPLGASLPIGIEQAYSAFGIFTDGTTSNIDEDVSWTISDNDIASITSVGIVKALAQGTAVVTATSGAIAGQANLTVTAAELAQLQIIPLEVIGPVGKQQQLTLIAYYSDGTTSDATQEGTWTSTLPNIAFIDNSAGREGQLTLLSEGTASISASWDGQEVARLQIGSNSIDVTVTPAVLVEIVISPTNESVPIGIDVDYSAIGIYSDLSNQDVTSQVSWNSSETTVATITIDGKATALAEGTATISAALSGVTTSTALTVTPATVVSVAIDPPFLDGPSGRFGRLTATALLSDNSTEDVTRLAAWQSMDTTIAGVVPSGVIGGVVEFRLPGSTQISVNYQSSSDVISVQVSDAVLEQINIQPVDASVAAGLGVLYTASGLYSDGQSIDISTDVAWQSSDISVAAIGKNGEAFTGEVGTAMISATLNGIASSVPIIVTDAVLTEIQLTPVSISAPSGTQAQLNLIGYYSDGSARVLTADATFTSSDTDVAQIQTGTSDAGSVSLLSVGTATATATFDGFQKTSSITVTAAVLESISVTPFNQSKPIGINTQYQAFGLYSDGGSKDISSQVSWSSSDTTVASISPTGVAVGLGTGTAVIMANDDVSSIVGETNLSVTDAVLTDLVIDPRSLNEPVGTVAQLTARAYFSDGQEEDATAAATWTSNDTAVVDVVGTGANAGRVTMIGVGSAEVSATWNGIRTIINLASNVTDTIPITVTNAELVSIELSPLDSSLPVGVGQPYIATGFYTDSSNRDITNEVTWQTSDQSVAVILSSGLLATVGQGVTSVSAASDGISESTTLTVTPAVVTSISVTPSLVDGPAGSVVVFVLTAFYSDNSNQDVSSQATWSSSNTDSVLVVPSGENGGLASLEAEGTATITASFSGFTSTASVSVTPAVISSVQINPASVTVAKGLGVQYELIATYSDGTSTPVTENVSWRTSDPSVAAISNEGVALGLGQGDAIVSAQFGTLSDDALIIVSEPILADLQIEPASVIEPAGTIRQLVATAIYTDFSTQDVTTVGVWSSDNETIARVGVTGNVGGELEFISVGSTVVNMSFGGQQASTSVVTTDAVLTSIVVTPPIESVPAGMDVQFHAEGIYSNNTANDITNDVTWQTTESTIATIDQTGLAQGVGVGITAVSATLGSIQTSVPLVVTNAVVTSIQVTPPNFSGPAGTSKQYSAQASFSDGSSSDATSEASWASEDESVATIIAGGQSGGFAELIMLGSTRISASLSGFTNTVDIAVTAAVLETISVSPVNEEIPLGIEVQYQANGTYSDGTSSVLTGVADWSSTVPETITISESGFARGVGIGSAMVRASFEGILGATNATVTSATLSSIEITPAFLIEPKGTSFQLSARAIYSDGTTQDATEEATWLSSDTTKVIVGATGDSGGLATMIDTGVATISVSWNGIQNLANIQFDSIDVQVTDAVLESIQINPVEKSLPAGTQEQYSATGIYSDNTTTDLTNSVAWLSGSVATATIDGDGLLEAVSVGQTTITATSGAISEVTNVTVTEALLESLQITPAGLTEPAGTSGRLTLTASYSDNTNKNVTTQASWVSSVPAIATVVTSGTDAGLVNLLSVGTTNVTASFEGLNDVTPITVTDAELVSISLSPFDDDLPVGIEQSYTATGIFTDDSSSIINEDVDWTISDSNIASITSEGVVKALAEGVVVVTATAPGAIVGQTNLTVTAATLTDLQIAPPGLQEPLGTTHQLTVLAYFSDGSTQDATEEATWVSGDSSIIAVGATGEQGGFVTTVSQGSTTITVGWDGEEGLLSSIVFDSIVTIVSDIELVSIEVTPKKPTSALGNTRQFTATGIYTDNTSSDLSADAFWNSSATGVATIGDTGLADTISQGVTTITASLSGVSGATDFNVSAATIVDLQITPAGLVEPAGTSGQLTATAFYSDDTQSIVTDATTWTSSDANVVQIGNGGDDSGLAQLIMAGTADVTATFDGFSDVTPITVTAAVVESITIAPINPSTNLGLRTQFSATGIYSDGSSSQINEDVDWQSADRDVAVIDEQGEAFALGIGTSAITATYNGDSDINASTVLTVAEAIIVDLYIQPALISDPKGTVRQLKAFAEYSNGDVENVTQQMTWTSADPSIASVDTSDEFTGELTLVSEGATTVSITWNNTLAVFFRSLSLETIPVIVTPATLESLEISPLNAELPVGLEQQYSATGIYTDGSNNDVTDEANWTTSNNSAATLSNTGLAIGISAGDTTITATFGGLSSATNLTVSAPVLEAGQVSPAGLEEPAGTSGQFTFIGTYSDGTEQDLTQAATWISDDPTIVSVVTTGEDAGFASLLSIGAATITASFDGVEDSTDVIVTNATLVRIEVDPSTLETARGGITQFTATGVYSDGHSTVINSDVTWTSSDSKVIIVTPTGQSQSLKQGTATVFAKLDGLTGTASVTVTGEEIAFLQISPSQNDLTIEQGTQYSAFAIYDDFTSIDVTDRVTWSVSDPAIASISNGEDKGFLKALTAGEVTIFGRFFFFQGIAGLEITAPTIITVDIIPANTNLVVGTNSEWEAIANFDDEDSTYITTDGVWTTTDTSVATVTKGVVTAVGPGSASIAIAFRGETDVEVVTVSVPNLDALVVSPAPITVPDGTSQQFTAIAQYDNGTNLDVTKDVTWSSSATNVATISNAIESAGLSSTVSVGLTNVTAVLDGDVSNIAVMTVEASVVDGFVIEPMMNTVSEKSKMQYRAILQFGGGPIQDVTDDADWGSDDKKTAKVDNGKNRGKVTAEKEGSTVITARYEDDSGEYTAMSPIVVTAECDDKDDIVSIVIVTDPSDPSSTTATTTVGGTLQLHALVTYDDGGAGCTAVLSEGNGLNWKSLDNDVVDVEKEGEVTGLDVGLGDVEAKIKGDTTTITVTVN